MAASPPQHISAPLRNVEEFTTETITLNAQQIDQSTFNSTRPPLERHDSGRVSFRDPPSRKPGQGLPVTRTFTGGSAGGRSFRDAETLFSPSSERPPIPSALPSAGPGTFSTPLPILPMTVLSITMLGEFLSANVSTPFLLFMVEGFFLDDANADIGYWTGILVSTFFLSQFLTSLLWATVAERHGQRAVLFVSLLGSAFTCVAFGTSKSLSEALTIRLLQGIFAGSIGVARSSITNITDGSNEGRAYAILGFSWGLGGVLGAIVGGTFETPANKWPKVFSGSSIFSTLPYLLPCLIAGSITFIGAVLSLFLARDGGPRGSAIRLPIGKEGTEPVTEGDGEVLIADDDDSIASKSVIHRLQRKVSNVLPRVFARRVPDVELPSSPLHHHLIASPSGNRRRNSSTAYRPSRATGSAYGYGAGRARLSNHSFRPGSLVGTIGRRRGTFGGTITDAGGHHENVNFAQRLLMANEMAVTNIADLWVAAAMNVDNEEVFISDDEALSDEEQFDDQHDAGATGITPVAEMNGTRTSIEVPRTSTVDSSLSRGRRLSTVTQARSGRYFTPSRTGFSALPSSAREAPHMPHLRPRSSRAFSTSSSQIPSIYANTGVRPPPGLMEEIAVPLQTTGLRQAEDLASDPLNAIPETPLQQDVPEKLPSVFKQLPLMIIFQYGLLALHSTTHDQVFLSYLVSKYEVGGLGLNAANFAQLIALMSLAQIAYQFYLYPNMGPPRGRFSHLAMFRLGSFFFIPSYLSVILYRVFANSDGKGSFVIMTLLSISTAIRYCGITFAYTAIAILLNYVSPPSVVGIANGLAQSIVSLARFAGPVLGGYVWSISVQNHPGGYPLGFLICSGVCAFAILSSFLIR